MAGVERTRGNSPPSKRLARCERIHRVNIRLQVLCASWNKTKVTALLAEEQPLTAWEERRKELGSNDATLFDYCNCSNQPADRDIIDCLRLNPKVNHRVHSMQPRHRTPLFTFDVATALESFNAHLAQNFRFLFRLDV